MKYLLDTDTCVYALRGRASVREKLEAVGIETIAISVITLAELRYGAACSARPLENQQAVDDFIQGLDLLGVDPAVARQFGEVKAGLRLSGKLIEDFDLLIAATAFAFDLILVSNNYNHFQRIPGLQLETWVQKSA